MFSMNVQHQDSSNCSKGTNNVPVSSDFTRLDPGRTLKYIKNLKGSTFYVGSVNLNGIIEEEAILISDIEISSDSSMEDGQKNNIFSKVKILQQFQVPTMKRRQEESQD